MRIIETEQIESAVAELCVKANTVIRPSIREAIKEARKREKAPLACFSLETITQNAEIAEREKLPVCQDTGMAVVFVTIGSDVHVNGFIEDAVNEGVRRGYREGYFRNSIVKDPIDRINTKDNTPAVIHYDFILGDSFTITVAPKGFGSENMSRICMLNPSDGISGVEDFVCAAVKEAGANPCPPVILGVGIGGTMEKAAMLSKQALTRDLGEAHPDPFWANTEKRLLSRINSLGIGPSGYGGETTALGVHILTYPTHIAGLPVAVNIGCHATRHHTAVI